MMIKCSFAGPNNALVSVADVDIIKDDHIGRKQFLDSTSTACDEK